MAKGRKPKPTTLKIAAETFREDRHGDGGPSPDPSFPAPPPTLGAAGKKEWKRVRAACESLGYIAELDLGVLAMYCESWEAYWKAKKMGDDMRMRHWADRVVKYGAELGFSPSSRTRCRTLKKETKGSGKVPLNKTG